MTNITITGNLTADPELRFTPSGAAVANFTVAVTERVKDGDAWRDGDTTFYNCSVWRGAAENATESLVKGTRVIVTGRLKNRKYQNAAGEDRFSLDVDVDEVGPSLKFATARVERVSSAGSQGAGWDKPARRPQAQPDPWATDDSSAPF